MALWDKISSRGNVEDRRSAGSLIALGGGGLSIGGLVLVLALNYLSGGNVSDVLEQLQTAQPTTQTQTGLQSNQPTGEFAGADNYEVFASTVLGSTNDMWSKVFAENNRSYTPPKLVLFRQATKSSCGISSSDIGPHYCPRDSTIYLDETFFDELRTRFKAQGGDVAEAYVIAHEVGHHAQNQLGIMSELDRQQNSTNENAASIKLELQADCFAGLWANSVKNLGVFEPGEINEALDAAAAVGDDRIQTAVEGQINPETWTHGSAEQRVQWFNRGYDSGSLSQCNTFSS